MAQIKVSGFLICPTMADADRASELLVDHIRLSRAEPGCLHFEVVRSMSDPLRFALNETFRDRAAFDAHQTRTKTSIWGQSTQHLERQFKVTEV